MEQIKRAVIRLKYKRYLNSKQWLALRQLVLERANGKCEKCGNPAQAVHHKKYPNDLHNDCTDNLIAVCNKCHKEIHHIKDIKIPNLNEKWRTC